MLKRYVHKTGPPLIQKNEQAPVVQPRLAINTPGDVHERQADEMADKVVSTQGSSHQHYSEELNKPVVQMKSAAAEGGHHASGEFISQLNGSKGSGEALPAGTQGFMENAFSADFSRVRVHDNDNADAMNRGINARAFTHGSDIYFRRGEYNTNTQTGKHLLAHELTHLQQQGNIIRRKIVPEDVGFGMVGQLMELTDSVMVGASKISKGALVLITAWSNTSDTADVELVVVGLKFTVPKILLTPPNAATGLYRYSSGVPAQASAVTKADMAIAAEKARKGGPRPGEIPRLTALKKTKEKVLNQKLIEESMYNRFDARIIKWVAHYNIVFAKKGYGLLDPNIVKAMLFQESQVGTAGEHMGIPPTHPVKTIHNLMQVIDSSASALLIMMKELEPALITTYDLTGITAATAAKPAKEREAFMWSYIAPGKTKGFWDAVTDFFSTPAGKRNEDYDFWIQTAVRWLFEKRGFVSSWAEAVRAYNGSGPRANKYRDAVMLRVSEAGAAHTAGTDYKPHR